MSIIVRSRQTKYQHELDPWPSTRRHTNLICFYPNYSSYYSIVTTAGCDSIEVSYYAFIHFNGAKSNIKGMCKLVHSVLLTHWEHDGRCCDVESTSLMTLIQRRNNVVYPMEFIRTALLFLCLLTNTGVILKENVLIWISNSPLQQYDVSVILIMIIYNEPKWHHSLAELHQTFVEPKSNVLWLLSGSELVLICTVLADGHRPSALPFKLLKNKRVFSYFKRTSPWSDWKNNENEVKEQHQKIIFTLELPHCMAADEILQVSKYIFSKTRISQLLGWCFTVTVWFIPVCRTR